MIVQILGKLVEKKEQSIVVNVNGLFYEIIVPISVLNRIDQVKDSEGCVKLSTYYYFQLNPSSGSPVLIGFLNELEKEFFLQFITVSGIGPRAAVKALNRPISEITKAIDTGDIKYLKTLPGIGMQRAKEIVAKLQGKVGKFGLIQDKATAFVQMTEPPDWQEEALDVLLQLQYKRQEAVKMIEEALGRSGEIQSAESLLNEIYKQKVKG